jgi:hypothetical protein
MSQSHPKTCGLAILTPRTATEYCHRTLPIDRFLQPLPRDTKVTATCDNQSNPQFQDYTRTVFFHSAASYLHMAANARDSCIGGVPVDLTSEYSAHFKNPETSIHSAAAFSQPSTGKFFLRVPNPWPPCE